LGARDANVPLAGSLDPSFGTGGVVTGPGIGGIAVQADRKIVVVAGGSLVRYLPDGSLDSSFGEGGYVQIPVSEHAVALQPDGKIVVAGSSSPPDPNAVSEFALARYNPDGSLDTSFGADGITNTAFPEQGTSWSASANALAILPDGNIVAAGTSGWEDGCLLPPRMFALARYTPDGTLDPTFGDGGRVQTEFDGPLAGIAVQPDGKIVATGTALDGTACGGGGPGSAAIAVARYGPDGSLDPTFGTSGQVTTFLGGTDVVGGPPILQAGKILVTGQSAVDGSLVVARYQASSLHFARIRRVTGTPAAVLTQKDGKILVAVSNGVVRLLPNGRLDASFGKGGIVSLPGATTSALALQTDRKILVGNGNGNGWSLARLIGGNNCIVPRLRGKTVSKASATLKKAYCRRGRVSARFSSKVSRGRVISPAPAPGTRLHGGAKVNLVVSKGKRP
jgi:uncharacterized delta-60 repeat protein